MLYGPIVRPILITIALLSLCACTTDGNQDRTPDPGAPTLSALSLMRYSYFRGGTGYPKSVPISPAFNPVVLDYYAITDAGTYAVYPETGTPDTKMTVSFKSQADTASQGKPTDNGYVPAGTQGDFLVVVQDTVKDLETTYLIRVEAH